MGAAGGSAMQVPPCGVSFSCLRVPACSAALRVAFGVEAEPAGARFPRLPCCVLLGACRLSAVWRSPAPLLVLALPRFCHAGSAGLCRFSVVVLCHGSVSAVRVAQWVFMSVQCDTSCNVGVMVPAYVQLAEDLQLLLILLSTYHLAGTLH